ncbi:hypothetical protein TNCV_2281871 [Trichonephila clavipes]|nr:hypothetical protein TNCV_2281871 [Trichonephila clavipes]
MPVLKDTEASLDIGCEKYAAPEMFTGEHASIKHILDNGMACLRPAELRLSVGWDTWSQSQLLVRYI